MMSYVYNTIDKFGKKYLINETEINKQLLDPLGTICKLVALNFAESNTKLSMQDHIMTLQQPNTLQPILRTFNGDGRENISELYYPIIRTIEWYLNPSNDNEDNDINNSDEIKMIVGYAILALKKLQTTYTNGNVIFCIQYYINLLTDALDGTYNENKTPDCVKKEYSNLLDYEKIKNFWDLKKIKTICELYKNCFETIESDKENFNILNPAYIKSIDNILANTDKEFQKLIKNSNKG